MYFNIVKNVLKVLELIILSGFIHMIKINNVVNSRKYLHTFFFFLIIKNNSDVNALRSDD